MAMRDKSCVHICVLDVCVCQSQLTRVRYMPAAKPYSPHSPLTPTFIPFFPHPFPSHAPPSFSLLFLSLHHTRSFPPSFPHPPRIIPFPSALSLLPFPPSSPSLLFLFSFQSCYVNHSRPEVYTHTHTWINHYCVTGNKVMAFLSFSCISFLLLQNFSG